MTGAQAGPPGGLPTLAIADDGMLQRMLRLALGELAMLPWLRAELTRYGTDPDLVLDPIRSVSTGWNVVAVEGTRTLQETVEAADVLVVGEGFDGGTTSVGEPLLRVSPRLRAVVHLGLDLVEIDDTACSRRGIVVVPVERATTVNVAEHALALLMALLRGLAADARVTSADEVQEATRGAPRLRLNWKGVQGVRTVAGLRVGVLGMADIGQAFAKRVAALGGSVRYWSRRRRREVEDRLGVGYVGSVEELAAWADAVSVHVASVPALHQVVDARFLELLGPNGLLVNTARYELVDVPALVSALASRQLAGAAFDVLSREPPLAEEPLLRSSGSLVTAHLGGGDWARAASEVADLVTAIESLGSAAGTA